jgi:hypothetical protein
LCDLFRRTFLGFERFRYFGQTRCDLARDLGGGAGRIERLRVEPDRLEPVAHIGLSQVFQIDAKALAVGKLRVVFSLPGEVGIDLDAMADVTDQDERRPAVRGRQRAGIFLGLPLGIKHQHVPGAACASAAAIAGVFFRGEQIVLPGNFLRAALPAALLGFQNKGVLAVQIDAADGVAFVAMARHHALEYVVITLMTGLRGIGPWQVERVTELG